jgi:KUP system potassium uptake protein
MDLGAESGSPAARDAQGGCPASAEAHTPHGVPFLVLAALGVVFGDIGTSPIYAFREALHASSGGGVATREDILGVLSLIVWALTLVVTVKYVVYVLRADNRGEGGTLSLMALARACYPRRSGFILAVGLCGASLFYGDAVITPAISVLSAVEGLEVVTPAFKPYVVPITLVVLAALFAVQRFGTGSVATVFGPVMAAWFLALAIGGISHIADDPAVILALNPIYAGIYLVDQPELAFLTIGAVFLAVTGAEALYVDLGHFGRRPIVTGWIALVFPSLLLNYFGQGAFVLSHGGVPKNPFFEMLPEWALVPMVALATAATVIASQAVISGAFSLTKQAVQLNLLPRQEIRHTSERQSGQIYLPRVNFLLAVAVMLLVVGFRESSALAAAYGISVTGEMLMTTVLLAFVMRKLWGWKPAAVIGLTLLFGLLDISFFSANAVKILEGGWISVGVAILLGVVMWTWLRGSRLLLEDARKNHMPLDLLADNLGKKPPLLVPGTAVFLSSDPHSAPSALLHSLKHYHALHEENVILSVVTAAQPTVPDADRVTMERINEHFMRVTMTFGFMEQPHVPSALAICRKQGWKFNIMMTSFFVSRRSLKPSARSGMPLWQDRLFIFLSGTAADATEYFQIPTDRVVEVGTQVTI